MKTISTRMEDWSNTRVLVTGGGGFIGSHLVRAVVDAHAIVAVTTETPAMPWRLEDIAHSITIEQLSLPDMQAADRLLAQFRPSIVYHLAGLLPADGRTDADYEAVNTNGTLGLFEAASSARVQHFVTLGSASEYAASSEALREDGPETPDTAYGRSKLAATNAVRKSHSIRTTVVRPASVYGPAQTGRMFVPDCIRCCMKREPFRFSSRGSVDLVEVTDVVEALMRMPEREGGMVEVLNLGSGQRTPLLALADRIADHFDARAFLDPYDTGPHEGRQLVIDRARTLLGWSPRTTLAHGIERTIEWYRANTHVLDML